ncbi:MAG: thioredoxin family protein [Acidobacteria bacterium]|nr:thioredoxin family protein [Acidobacteriota bacterium]
MRKALFNIAVLLILFPLAVFAQNPSKWKLESAEAASGFKAGREFKATLTAEVEPGWNLYSLDQPKGGPYATTINVAEASPFEIVGEINAPDPIVKPDPNFIIDGKPLMSRFYQERAAFEMTLRPVRDAEADELKLDVRFQICNDSLCLPPRTKRVSFSGEEDVGRRSVAQTAETPSDGQTVQTQTATVESSQTPTDLGPFIWLAISLALISLLTPCVFPMIPITVSYFTNHSSGSRAKSVKLAFIYSVGIIATFTLLGMMLAFFVGAAGINLFAANPYINLLITAIFLFFAFNLFGAYEINIPTGVLTKLDSLTRSAEGEGSGIAGALLMGLTFTLTSFTCTSPFVGTLLVATSQGEWEMPLIGMLVFSTVFALPFFVLALIPQLASQLPRAGGWMNSVKVAMGFLEVAAAMKFISNVDLIWKWGIFTRNTVLAIWIAIGIILTLYLLGKFQLAHDSKPERLGVGRVMSAILSLAVSFYLLTGLFGGNLGELEAFLPLDTNRSATSPFNSSGERLEWIKNDYEGALARGKAENKRVFLDFTGYTCTNCRWMEANIFPKQAVQAEFAKMVLVSLYTDGIGDIYEKNYRLEEEKFGTVALPLYAIVEPDGKIIATFAGITRDENEFVNFLKKGTEQ